MRNILYHLSLVTIAMTYALLFYIAFLMFYPVTSFRLIEPANKTTKTQYKEGEVVSFKVNSCRYNNNQGTVERIIRNVKYPSVAYSIPTTPLVAQVGTCGERLILVALPMNMLEGEYHIENTIRIHDNLFRTEVYNSETLPFTVTK